MKTEEYEKAAMRTDDGKTTARLRAMMNKSAQELLPAPGALIMGALGLTGEAGEVSDAIKKHVFHGHELSVDHLVKELGDVLWYVAFLCKTLNVSMEEVMNRNVAKLKERYPEGFSEEASRNRRENEKI